MGNQQSQGSQSDQVLDNDDSVRRNSTAFRRNSDFSKKANTACLERLFQVMHLKRCLCKQIPKQLSGVIYSCEFLGIISRAPDRGCFFVFDAKKMGKNGCSLKPMRQEKCLLKPGLTHPE